MDLREKFDAAMTNVMGSRQGLVEARENTVLAKEALKDQEAGLIQSGQYTASGKNEKEREAWLRGGTIAHRNTVLRRESEERVAVYRLELALDARRNLESILKIEELER